MTRTLAHAIQEHASEYAYGDCESAQISASDREAEIWNDAEQLSDVLAMVRGPLDYSATVPSRQQGREAIEHLQRAYNAKSDAERAVHLSAFARTVYHDLIDFVEVQAGES